MTMPKALTIAGSDTSGGAGMQADLKTFQELGVYGMTALTTIVAQDPHNHWFHAVYPLDLKALEAQLETVLAGIGVDALKTGMLGSVDVIELAAQKIEQYKVENVVIDPVMVCKGADEVLHPETAWALRDVLIPKALVATPNLFEAGHISGLGALRTIDDMKEAARVIHEKGAKYVLVKGGGKLLHPKAVDVLFDGQDFEVLEGERINTPYVHGAGCTYAAAITAGLAKGQSVKDAVYTAKEFVTAAIRESFKLNEYVGPTKHGAYRNSLVK